MIPTQASLLRLYINASDRWHGEPLYQAVVAKAQAGQMAGASVFPVELSFGGHHRLRDASSEYLFADIPVVVELVDAPDRVEAFLAELRPMLKAGLATIEAVRVIRYSPTSPA